MAKDYPKLWPILSCTPPAHSRITRARLFSSSRCSTEQSLATALPPPYQQSSRLAERSSVVAHIEPCVQSPAYRALCTEPCVQSLAYRALRTEPSQSSLACVRQSSRWASHSSQCSSASPHQPTRRTTSTHRLVFSMCSVPWAASPALLPHTWLTTSSALTCRPPLAPRPFSTQGCGSIRYASPPRARIGHPSFSPSCFVIHPIHPHCRHLLPSPASQRHPNYFGEQV